MKLKRLFKKRKWELVFHFGNNDRGHIVSCYGNFFRFQWMVIRTLVKGFKKKVNRVRNIAFNEKY